MCFSRRKGSGWVIDQEHDVVEARRLALRAVQSGKDDAVVLCQAGYALAFVVGDLDNGAAFFDRALSINPNVASGWSGGGMVKLWLGDPDRAVEYFARAMRLSPLLFFTQYVTAQAHFYADRYHEAFAWAKMAMRELPDSHPVLRIAAASCALTGRGEEAKILTARLLEIDPALRISNIKMFWAPTASRNTLQNTQMLCERRAYLNDGHDSDLVSILRRRSH